MLALVPAFVQCQRSLRPSDANKPFVLPTDKQRQAAAQQSRLQIDLFSSLMATPHRLKPRPLLCISHFVSLLNTHRSSAHHLHLQPTLTAMTSAPRPCRGSDGRPLQPHRDPSRASTERDNYPGIRAPLLGGIDQPTNPSTIMSHASANRSAQRNTRFTEISGSSRTSSFVAPRRLLSEWEASQTSKPISADTTQANIIVKNEDNGSLDVHEPFLIERRRSGRHLVGFFLPFDDPLALDQPFKTQWRVLSSAVADISCSKMTPEQLHDILSLIFDDQRHSVDSLRAVLSDFIHQGSDLGQIYGYLRAFWGSSWRPQELQSYIRKLKETDDEMRKSAIAGDLVTNRSIPPRRVWDLYSNRVLPYYFFSTLRRAVQPVSHSWRPPSERQSVLTAINGKEWRVPIPRDTTLDAVRNELLLLGAEYVWLDALCLRQRDVHLPEQEDIREREWRLDIPSIGSVYRQNLPVLVWFNGLGLPFRDGPVDPNDQTHWMNRAWTLQELSPEVIIGGLRPAIGVIDLRVRSSWPPESTISTSFLKLLTSQPTQSQLESLPALGATLRHRFYSNPVDIVACLSYFMMEKVPIYDLGLAPEVAWGTVIANMTAAQRTRLLFADFGPRSQPGPWHPSWEEFRDCLNFKTLGDLDPSDTLKPVPDSQGSIQTYYHQAFVIEGASIRVPLSRSIGGRGEGTVQVPPRSTMSPVPFTISEWGGCINSDVKYVLIGCNQYKNWVVAKKDGTQVIGGEKALRVVKISTMTGRFYSSYASPPLRLVVYC